MPPKSAAKPKDGASLKRTRKGSAAAGAGNGTVDGFVNKKPRISPKQDNSSSTAQNKLSDKHNEQLEDLLANPDCDEDEDDSEETTDLDSSTGRGGKNQLDRTLPPIKDTRAAFWDMIQKSIPSLENVSIRPESVLALIRSSMKHQISNPCAEKREACSEDRNYVLWHRSTLIRAHGASRLLGGTVSRKTDSPIPPCLQRRGRAIQASLYPAEHC